MANNTMAYSAEYLAEDRTALVIGLYSLPIPLEILSTLFRLWVKASPTSEGHLGYDDYLIAWATITAVAECVAGLVYGPPNGLGRHVQALKQSDVSKYLQGDYIFSHFYDFAIVSTKLSVLALYHRIFVTTKMRIVIRVTAALVVAWLIEMEVVLGLGCQPIQGWWDSTVIHTAKCVNKVAFTYSTNILNLIFDLWIFAMPIPVILKLNMNMEKRIALCFLFSIGLGVCAISIARLSVIFSAGSNDVTWYEIPLGILSAWEPCGAILVANLPIIYRAIAKGFKNIGNSIKSTRPAGYGSRTLASRYKDSESHDWARINSSGNKGKAGFPTTSVTRGAADSEQELTMNEGIRVEQEFELQSTRSNRLSKYDTLI